QAIVEVVEGVCQTEVRVPWSRWVETKPPEAPTDSAPLPAVNTEVLKRLEDSVRETATLDVLSDDWGNLSRTDRTLRLLKPFATSPHPNTPLFQVQTEVEEEEEEEEEDESHNIDILKLKTLQKKMMKRIHLRRALDAEKNTPLQRFFKHYHQRLEVIYPEETVTGFARGLCKPELP
ncbi:unnamed protein product, partial [Meganyctiphanes norvegica]